MHVVAEFLAYMPQVSETSINDWIPFVLGGGAAGFLATATKFILAWRSSAETREAKAISNLERWRDDADARATNCLRRLDHQRDWSAYWQTRAAAAEHMLVLNGMTPPVPPAPPAMQPINEV